MTEEIQAYDAVLLDIEGTIAPISFAYDVLFPYALDRVARFLKEHWDEMDVQNDVEDLRRLAYDECAAGRKVIEIPDERSATRGGIQKAVREYVQALIQRDSKTTALKSLQGKIWRDGYESGEIQGEFYDDAVRALARWNARGIVVGVYSSASVEAQQLLFEHSTEGDLRPFVSFWFDTTIGSKRERESYEKIADEMDMTASSILFATDAVAEAQAARAGGMQVVILDRLGNEKQPPHPFPVETDLEMA